MPAPKGNQYGLDNSGRPKRYPTIEGFEKAIEDYFEECDNNTVDTYNKLGEPITIKSPIPYTVEGLCLALGFTSREALINYEKKQGYEEYFDTLKTAKLRIQNNKVVNSLNGTYNPATAIFDLKNNHGYRDKTETEHSGKLDGVRIYLPDNGRNKD